MLRLSSSSDYNTLLWRLLSAQDLSPLVFFENDGQLNQDIVQNCSRAQLVELMQLLKGEQKSKLELGILSKQIVPVKKSFDQIEHDHRMQQMQTIDISRRVIAKIARLEAKGREFVSLVENIKESYHHVSLDADQHQRIKYHKI